MGVLGAIAGHLDALIGPGVMLLFPLYASMRAIDDQQWLTYWVLYSFITLFELSCRRVLQWQRKKQGNSKDERPLVSSALSLLLLFPFLSLTIIVLCRV